MMITLFLLALNILLLITLLLNQRNSFSTKNILFAGVSLSISLLVIIPSIGFLIEILINNGEIFFPLRTVTYSQRFLNLDDHGLNESFAIILIGCLLLLITCKFIDRFINGKIKDINPSYDIKKLHIILLGLLVLIMFYPILITGNLSLFSNNFYTRAANLPFATQISYLHLSLIFLISTLFHCENILKNSFSKCLPNILTITLFVLDSAITGNRFVLFPLVILSLMPIMRNSKISIKSLGLILLISLFSIVFFPLVSLIVLYLRSGNFNSDLLDYIVNFMTETEHPFFTIYHQIFESASPFVLLKIIAEVDMYEGLPISNNPLFFLPYDSLFTFVGELFFSWSNPPTFSTSIYRYFTDSSDSSYSCTFMCEWIVKYGIVFAFLFIPIYMTFSALIIKRLFPVTIAAPATLIYAIMSMRYSSSILIVTLFTTFLLWNFSMQLSKLKVKL